MNQEKVIVIDFGGQYNQLVARRVRECNVYCEIYSYKTPLEQIKAMNLKELSLQVVRIAAMKKVHLLVLKSFLNLVFQCLDYVMVRSLCSTFLAARLRKLQ